MPIEIERKYLVRNDAWRARAAPGELIRQGYLSNNPFPTVRIRLCGALATVSVKGPRIGIARDEFEYPIPRGHAEHMLRRLCVRMIEKVRHRVDHHGAIWHVDEYRGAAAGLVVAEIELDFTDQEFALPRWLGAEVTHDPRYRNSAIALPGWSAPLDQDFTPPKAAIWPPRRMASPPSLSA
jgi:adenylate cyclase